MINPTGLLLATACSEGQQLGHSRLGFLIPAHFLLSTSAGTPGHPAGNTTSHPPWIYPRAEASAGAGAGGLGWEHPPRPCSVPVSCCGVHRQRVLRLWVPMAGVGAAAAPAPSRSWLRLLESVTMLQSAQHHTHSDAPLPASSGAGPGFCHPVCDQQG